MTYKGRGNHSISELEDIIEGLIRKVKKWDIGEKVEVRDCFYGHEFNIGEIVEIIEYSEYSPQVKWLCRGINGFTWWLSEEEGLLI